VPGYRRYPALSLSQHAPPVSPPIGGITASFGAPVEESTWRWDFTGTIRAQLALGVAKPIRSGSSGLAFHIPPRQAQNQLLQGVGTTLNFVYGNAYAEAHVTWGKTLVGKEYTGFYQPGGFGAQGIGGTGIGDAYVHFTLPELGGVNLTVDAGAMQDNFAGAGQYVWGKWNILVGTRGVGEAVRGTWLADPDWEIGFGQAFKSMRQIAENTPRNGAYAWFERGNPSYVHDYHASVTYMNEYQLRLHFASAFAPDLRSKPAASGTVDNPFTPGFHARADGRVDIYAADAHWYSQYYGHLGTAYAYYDLHNETGSGPVQDALWWTTNWGPYNNAVYGLTQDPNGEAMANLIEYNISVNRAIQQDLYDPNSSDLRLNFASYYAWVVKSRVPARKNAGQVALVAWADYAIIRWFGVGAQWEYQNPDSTVDGDEFQNIQGQLTFRSDWSSPDTVDLRYRHYFRSARTLINSNAPPDNDVVELIAQVTW
jgi:hypothetical protein